MIPIPGSGTAAHPHLVMELLGYSLGFWLYRVLRRRAARRGEPTLPFEQNVWVVVGCVMGALVGSKVLAWAESIDAYRASGGWLGGKTIVGGLLGGWVGVEIAKRRLGVTASTGDLFVFPLIVGICLGRVGCFLTGLADHTHGAETSLAWGVDFGDGVRRHPTQLYDVAVLIVIGIALRIRARYSWESGAMFRWFMLGYLAWRFVVEFIKPREIRLSVAGVNLSAIQVASLAGAAACARLLARKRPTGVLTGASDGTA
jgi:phosphatidylglycerol:prolipoprotein diacylglycerol transferase